MGYFSQTVAVPPEWEDVFAPLYFARNDDPAPVSHRLLPNLRTLLVFSLGTPASLSWQGEEIVVSGSIVVGPLREALHYTLPAGSDIVVVNFRFDAFYRFFGPSLHSWVPRQLPETLGHCFAGLREDLRSLATPEDRAACILAFSATYLRQRENPAERLIESGVYDRPLIKAAAAGAGQHLRTVQLNHKKYLGYTAKDMSRYQRFREALRFLDERVEKRVPVDWFEVVEAGGYYDQSHLIRDFQYYLGVPPSRFLTLRDQLCIAVG